MGITMKKVEKSKAYIYDMRTDDLIAPVGIDSIEPVFSWKVDSETVGWFQTAYQLVVRRGESIVWDSGKVADSTSVGIVYVGSPLAPSTEYTWTVCVWDGAGNVTCSECASFEMGPPPVKVETMKVCETRNPIGIDTNPVFSWIPLGETYVQFQAAYRVIVSSTAEKAERGEGDLWDSGRVESAFCYGIPYEGESLASHTGYYWKVWVWDGNHAVGISPVSKFVTGILDQSEWRGDWLGAASSVSDNRAATLLRKNITLEGEVEEAYLSIAGLGFFELLINGKTPDDTLLNCCNTQYNKTVLYRTFDVTSMLNSGENAIGVELGNGFYNEQGGVWNWQNAPWRDNPKMNLRMTVRYAGGRTEAFISDTFWQATVDGPTTFNSIYYGEIYDARKELGDWANADYDSCLWTEAQKMDAPEGKLICQIEDPIRRVATFEAKEIKKFSDGSYVVYAPEMITGWAKITFRNLTAGSKITILYGEKLGTDGSVQKLGGADGINAHWWPERYIMMDEYIAKGGISETYEPKFSYKGYGYIQIWGYAGELTREDVALYRIANDVEVTGSFESSDRLINDLHAMMVRTMTNNLQGKPTDTPVWEKNGWLGDLNVAMDTFTYNFDFSNFLPNFVRIMKDCFEQYGLLPQMVPTAGWGVVEQYVWNSVFVFAVYRLYKIYGMGYYMEEQYNVLKKYAQNIMESMGRSKWIASDGQLGDWVSPMNSRDAQYNESPNEGSGIVATAYVYKMLLVMAEMAKITGHSSDAEVFTDAAKNIYTAFNEKFYHVHKGYYETGVWYNNGPKRTRYRQTSQLVPLAFGLVPEDQVQKVVDNLVNDIVEKNYHLDTGCIGTKEILPVLSDCGYGDVAYKILTQRTYPSWGFMTENGATSLWEMWETTTRSRAHYFLGTYDAWLYQYLAGITDMEQGYLTFTINPYIPDELTYVTCTEDTVRGKLESSWRKNDDGTITMIVTVPFGSTARVYFPTGDASKVTWNGAAISDTMEGIREVGNDAGHAYVVLGSGSYVFRNGND